MEETICAISSAVGEAGIGIVRLSGEGVLDIVEEIFVGKSKIENRKMLYGFIKDGEKIIDEVLFCYMKAPYTYTREDVAEIYCHGGIVPVKEVLELCLKKGARLAERGEFTKRAFLNGRLDLTQAEAVIDIIKSGTSLSYRNSLNQLQGFISKKVAKIYDDMINVLASITANIDFPDDEVDTVDYEDLIFNLKNINEELLELIKSSKIGKVLRDGIKTLILGRPNVGKSSLMNALLKENRAIVTNIPGTTRDTIEEILDLDGVFLKLIDSAGIRHTEDDVEKIGVDRALSLVDESDLILLILDSSEELTDEDREILKISENKERIILINKTDLSKKLDYSELKGYDYIEISVKEGIGIDKLAQKIKELFFRDKIKSSSEAYVSNARQLDLLKKANSNIESAISDLEKRVPIDLVEVDLDFSLEKLGEVLGKEIGEDVLDRVFSQFCIGK